ncbi:hypothetical protein [Flavobacterium sp.]|uniref:hypothetical protein n=1 Tax=Flavobacterium sp. TaxID=239 RepID=UPI003C60ED23
MRPKEIFLLLSSLLIFSLSMNAYTISKVQNPIVLEKEAIKKIKILETLMKKAKSKSIDVTREETLLWFSKEFLKFANWDEKNKDKVEKLFGYYGPYKNEKTKYAEELPDLERQKVIDILDKGIDNLKKVIDGSITRRAVAKVDWKNIEVGKDQFISNGKPVFLYDYFSKTMGGALTDTNVYNDHLGAIYHGGINLSVVSENNQNESSLLTKKITFKEERLQILRDIPNKNVGFLLLWNSGFPKWISEKDPEVSKGRSLFTDYDIDNPLMRHIWGDVIKNAGEITKGKKISQLGYILSNEPHWFSETGHWTQKFKEMNSISSYTLNNFRNWLSIKYGNKIGELNTNWQSKFADFNVIDIEIPINKSKRGQAIWYDWCRYNMDRSIDWFTYIQKELHTVNPMADTHIKIMPDLFTEDNRSHGIDLEALTELTTMIGDDAKTTGGRSFNSNTAEEWEEKYAFSWDELAVSYDFMESVAPNKIHVNSETHFLSSSHWKDLNTSPDYTRSCFWLATLHGMDAGLSWFWARDPDGSPEDRLEGTLNFFDPALAGSYAGSVNMQPQTANELAQVMMDLNSYSEEIMDLRHQRKPVRFFYSETSAIQKPHYMSEHFGLYESLYFEGFPLGYATEKIIKKQDNKNWDVIVVYKTEFVTDSEFEALQNYLNNGGTVIVDSTSLSKNEYGHIRKMNLQKAKGTLITMNNDVTVASLKKTILDNNATKTSDIVLKETNGTDYKGCTWRVVKNKEGNYLMTILNIGKNTAKLNLSLKNNEKVNGINMLTGEMLGSEFELKSKGVLLLEIK